MIRRLVSAFALTSILATAGPAAAQPRGSKASTDAKAAYAEGQRRYAAEDYQGAAAQFLIAHGLDPDPVYLFNVGQAYRFAKQCAEAVTYYRRFLRDAPRAPNKAAVERYLVDLEVCAKEQAAPIVAPDPAPGAGEPAEPGPTPPDAAVVQRASDGADRGRSRRRLGMIAGGVGLVAIGGGFYFMARVNSHEADRQALCPDPCTWTPGLTTEAETIADRGDRASAFMVTSFALGGAAVIGGVVLYVLGRTPAESQLAITPTRGGAMVSLSF